MNQNKGRVLIVDDEPNVRLVFRTALEAAGYMVAEAEDGETALDRLEGLSADMVLLDLQMPGVGGMEVLRQLRDASNNVPVVIVTAHGSIPDAVEAMKLGAIDFVSKPLRPEPLRKVVGEVVHRHAAAEPEPISARSSRPTTVTVAAPVIDLTAAKRALNRREFDRAVDLLEEALEQDPDSAEALTLMGVLRESLGQDHAAYHAYKTALQADPQYGPARDNLRRYCERFGLNFRNKAINPGAD
jgi:DNA-binding response OmpR family regulator